MQDSMISLLSSADPALRVRALTDMDLTRPGALQLLISCLKDSDWDVRSMACFNLGELRDNRAIAPLLAVVQKEPDERVRSQAFIALGEYRDSSIGDALLAEVHRDKRHRRPRQEVARQLRFYDSEEAVNALIVLLNDQDPIVHLDAAESLYQLNRPRLRNVWIWLEDDCDRKVRKIARTALQKLDG